MWKARNWLFCLSLLLLFILICYWLLGLNADYDEGQRKLRLLKGLLQKMDNPLKTIDELFSIEEVAQMADDSRDAGTKSSGRNSLIGSTHQTIN